MEGGERGVTGRVGGVLDLGRDTKERESVSISELSDGEVREAIEVTLERVRGGGESVGGGAGESGLGIEEFKVEREEKLVAEEERDVEMLVADEARIGAEVEREEEEEEEEDRE
jgi:hypothetical protein